MLNTPTQLRIIRTLIQVQLLTSPFIVRHIYRIPFKNMATATSDQQKSLEKVGMVNQQKALEFDGELFSTYKYTNEQLMEIAGLSCAQAVADTYPPKSSDEQLLLFIGPGNNGGDGLVAARHLVSFGMNPVLYYPKRPDTQILNTLFSQVQAMNITILDTLPSVEEICSNYSLILDFLFGFNFKKGVIRSPFDNILRTIKQSNIKIVSIDIPSGWGVDEGPEVAPEDMRLEPDTIISLTAPKLCTIHFRGKHHFLGMRVVPKELAKKYGINFPIFTTTKQYVEI